MAKISKDTLYITLIGLSVMILITSNIASTKMFDFFGTGLVWDGGVVLFPLAYVLSDVITEIYGFRTARRITWVTFAMNLVAVLALWIVQILPPGAGWENQTAYESIIGFMPRIVFGSLIAYVVGQILNAFIFARIKTATNGKRFWLRAIGSDLAGNLVDTLIFTTIAFYGTISTNQFIGLIFIAYISKTIFGVILTPLTYWSTKCMKKITGKEHFDRSLSVKSLFFN